MERADQSFEPAGTVFGPSSEGSAPDDPSFAANGARPEALAALQAHPRFNAAFRIAITGIVELWQRNRLLNTVMNDRGRLLISLYAVYLHLLSRPDDPHTGLTVSRMTALCSEQKFCSPGRAKAILMLMRVFGYLAPSPNEADRRLRRLVPTERLMSLHRERNRRIFGATAVVMPGCAEGFAAQSHPDFTALFVCRYCEQILAGFRFIDLVPDLQLFIERNAGTMVLCSMLLAGDADESFPPTSPVPVSASALSRRFGVSRAHVRRLLQDAENQGLLQRLEGERIRLSPRLLKAASDFIAAQFLLVAHCAQGAYAELRRERAVA
jgi:DNA-binding MarR family transcriptional regulator